jgi:hypothetical protein
MDLLGEYDARENFRVQSAALKLANGNLDPLRQHIAVGQP